MNIDKFLQGYVMCALWSSTLGDDCGTPMDRDYGLQDLHESAFEVMVQDCADFCEGNASLLSLYSLALSWDHAGHDFWLTRNGHGAGFWDRGLGELGDKLSDVARQCGESNLYIGDDQEIYIC